MSIPNSPTDLTNFDTKSDDPAVLSIDLLIDFPTIHLSFKLGTPLTVSHANTVFKSFSW